MALSRRQVLTSGLGVGAAVGLAGCSGLTSKQGAEAPASPGGKATLTFVNWSGDEEKKAFDDLIARFSQANPDITVKTDTVP